MEDYYLGLDLGTGSLGWAVTDSEYHILRRHGKALWGVRLFETANTAEDRRMHRTSRRRLARRNWRLELLQGIFAEEIEKVDPGFFLRMKESRYVPEDKRDKNGSRPDLPYALFVDPNYTDKNYHKQFPTIYHLRKWLMETDTTPDIRLVYLAFHHMIKHRGHFLLSGELSEIEKFETVFRQFIECVEGEELDCHLPADSETMIQAEQILKDRKRTRSDKKSELFKRLNVKTPSEKALVTLISGGTAKLSDIFGEKELNESERPKLSFADSNYEEYADSVSTTLGERYAVIEMAKAVYDWAILADILAGSRSLSAAKVAAYEKHKKDLACLKKVIREEAGREVYREVFVKTDASLANYCAYVGVSKKNGKKQELEGKQCSKEDFYAYLKKKVLPLLKAGPETDYLRTEIERGTFLPKQVTGDNCVLPNQLHLYEMDGIIENLKNRIPLIAKEGDRIRSILTFRIPYYVGPLNGIPKGNSTTNWVVRKPGKIYPWNFEEMIDLEQCAEKFIRRMTNRCTYLKREDVLPKYSLLYSKFAVLNELNNLRLNGEPVDIDLKQRIYRDLFERYRKVTQKRLKNYLICEGIIDRSQAESLDIGGVEGDFKSSLTAYLDFKEKLTGSPLSEKEKEGIILNITLFGEDEKLLSKRLKKLYPALSEKQIHALCKLPYKGWGRLSEKFLEGIVAPAPETGEEWNIIRTLWETNDNLMQILSRKYLFAEAVEEENRMEEPKAFSYERVEELQVSPAVKRQIWQTMLIVKELCKVMKGEPKRVFIEMARGEETPEEKRRRQSMRDSRKKKLIELYKKCREEERHWVEELEETDTGSLRSDKLYLYYTQKGRCMYSGEVIQLEDLWNNQKYDIDHIYPQSKVIDDSLDNRVLVKKEENEPNKSDRYPVRQEIRVAQKPFWKSLLDGGFISKEKYNRLTRGTEFEPQELAGFIARQLVETRQGTKAVASILKQMLPRTKVVYVKAGIVSQFRQDYKLFKVREMNDLHHAKDAYLDIVAGNVYYVKFTGDAFRYIRENPGRSYHLKKMFIPKYDIKWGDEIAWHTGSDGTIRTVKEVMGKNNILVTRRSYQVKGELFDQQLMKKGKGQVPIKGSDTRLRNIERYGGYNKAAGAYFVLAESTDKKGKRIRTLEYVPVYLQKKLEDKEELKRFLAKDQGLKDPQVLLCQIKMDTLFSVDGFHMWLSGRTGNQLIFKGANQLILSRTEEGMLKTILNFVKRRSENREITITEHDGITSEQLLQLYDVFLDKIRYTVYGKRLSAQKITLTEKRDKFKELSLEEQCIVISEILHMFQCQSGSADLRLIGGPARAGLLLMNKEVSKCEKISIINPSPTGIYESEIDLKTI